MLSYDLTARHTVPGKGHVRSMEHLFNCCGAKANTTTYAPLRWKTVRCYDGKIRHDADPWRPDPTSMCLNVPHHRIDLNRSLNDQRWLGEHTIPVAVHRITKALCILDVFFGFDGYEKGSPVAMTDPFFIPEDLLPVTDGINSV